MFRMPCSTVVYAADGSLLSAIASEDGQWRFPGRTEVPAKFSIALTTFEDRAFHAHNGVSLPALLRASVQNLRAGEVVSGGSTLTMQVIRLSRKNPPRTFTEKIAEILLALRLECSFSKEEILALYASHAPFGGNVVGIDAAAWRYYGHPPESLSWAESATLAVLPNAPSLIFPGRRQDELLLKRNRLLHRLYTSGHMDRNTYELSLLEPLPGHVHSLPSHAPHLLHSLRKKLGHGGTFRTTIDAGLQMAASEALQRHIEGFDPSNVHNAAALVIEVSTGNVLAYVGNVPDASNRHGNQVDVVPARRSTGSILKPLLYASMLQDGLILPNSLVADIPVSFNGFVPENHTKTFEGAVPASQALSKSLNIPSVMLLRDYGYSRFYHQLKKMGFSHLDQPADHYGLSLILGGAEASLWDIAHAYAHMSRVLNCHVSGKPIPDGLAMRNLLSDSHAPGRPSEYSPIDAASAYCMFRALLEVNRPETELGWEAYDSSSPIAWKTGTSFGNRDAWAVGTTPRHVVAVWVGNADGQGRPALTGTSAAAPLMFELFGKLPRSGHFIAPLDILVRTPVCRESGFLPGPHCPHPDTLRIPPAGLRSRPCPFHLMVHLSRDGRSRLSADCESPWNITHRPWFVLPGVQEYYYRKKHPDYASLPPYRSGCEPNDHSPISIIYPKSDDALFIPRNVSGQKEKTVLKAHHEISGELIYWHLDDHFIGMTEFPHELEVLPEPGVHRLTLTDQRGYTASRLIRISGN